MKKLDKLRKKIDIIDDKILKLLQNRSKLALDIGGLKNKNSKRSLEPNVSPHPTIP